MSFAMSSIHPPSNPTAGSSSTSAVTRSGRAAARFSATAPPNECPTTTTGPASSRPASAPIFASMLHGAAQDDRPCPIRSGAADRDFGQMPRRERPPALAMPGQAVNGQDLGWARRSVTMHMQQVGHGLNAARRRQQATTAVCRTPRGVMRSCPRHKPN